ncbi:MAG TPA: Ig-like domain-containing protein [Candidatus Dormibacteraeota bacterium]|nr:Ig-like domain-containing protein [Candidatus Dormibacteraeota bacterium]
MAAGAVALNLALAACGGDPPQIVDYSPQRNSIDVSTAAPVRIIFDHEVDQASVESRLHLAPATMGSFQWVSGHELLYYHATLRTSTAYEVILESGYHDRAGNVYTLRHHWSFTTEGAPGLAGSTPANGEGGVDPAAYLGLDFTRAMDAKSLKSALTINPNVPFDVRIDPGDSRRAIIAPSQLLAADTDYQILLNTAALDVDGNQLGRDQTVRFTTGALQPLRHWIAFATDGVDGSPGGVWIVNESGFPRQLFDASAVRAFSWSPNGDSLLIEDQQETWWQYSPGGSTALMSFHGTWAAALASGMGYVYLDDVGALHRQGADGSDDVIATDVAESTVAPNGLRVAFIHATSDLNAIWGYDVGLRARYELALDSAPVSAVAWDPTGKRLAYLRHDPATTSLEVRNLTGAAATRTMTSGDIAGRPAWLPDATHLVFSAAVEGSTGVTHKAFVLNVAAPPAELNLAAGLPSDAGIDVTSPVSSPDGHQIAFLSGDQVWLMNADGTRPIALTKQDPASFPYSCRALAWTRS